MDLNESLLWMVGLSCGVLLVRGVRVAAVGAVGWLIVAGVIEAVMGISWFICPQYAGLIGGGLWLPFLMIPLLAAAWSRRLIERQQSDKAAIIARWIRLLHPFDGYWHHPGFYQAQFLVEHGDLDEALAIFDALRRRQDAIGRAASAGAMRVRRQWLELASWVENDLPAPMLRRDMTIFVIYLRALGETGQVEQMLKTFATQPRLLHQPALVAIRNNARLFVFAFTGEPRRAESLLYGGALSAMPEGMKQFWIATAEHTAGDFEAASNRLDRILPTASRSLRDAIMDRKSRPVAVNPLAEDEASRQLVEQADRDHRHELLYVRGAPDSRRLAVMTLVLILLNCITFLVEVASGGAMNWEVLYRLGAAETTSVRAGEWWRLLTANFLHLGWVHLAMNMLGLLVLGPFVERSFGRLRYAVLYLLAGVGGTAFVMIRNASQSADFEILVGASAAVMGLVGATGAILVVGWVRDNAVSALRRLRGVGIIVATQILFDSQNPHVSGTAHLAGCAAGFLLALPLCLLRRRAPAVLAAPVAAGAAV
jgi:rhomboid protease GluP